MQFRHGPDAANNVAVDGWCAVCVGLLCMRALVYLCQSCIPLIWNLMVQNGFEYFIAIVGSSIALVQQTLIKAR